MLVAVLVAVFNWFAPNASGQIADSVKIVKGPAAFSCCRPDGHSPIGVMTDHIHRKGEWSLTYSYMNMQMHGNLMGAEKVSDEQVYQNYVMAPNKMTMQMHMLMGMYGVTSKLTVMGMLNYVANDMSMDMMPMNMMMNMPGMTMNTANMPTSSKSSGLGDTKIYALYNVLRGCNRRLIFGMGLSIPTGSISAKGETMSGENQVLAYPMQIGTGTFDLLPSVAYTGVSNSFSWGFSAYGNIKTSTNNEGYAWGNSGSFTGWFAYKCCSHLSCSARVEGTAIGKMSGYDPRIAILMYNDPNANAANYGGTHATFLLGVNLYQPTGCLKGNRLQVEYGIPVYQNLNGPQMSMKGVLQLGLQHTFNMMD